jgi:hypothetical protein
MSGTSDIFCFILYFLLIRLAAKDKGNIPLQTYYSLKNIK